LAEKNFASGPHSFGLFLFVSAKDGSAVTMLCSAGFLQK
jgi:hypothetical protein